MEVGFFVWLVMMFKHSLTSAVNALLLALVRLHFRILEQMIYNFADLLLLTWVTDRRALIYGHCFTGQSGQLEEAYHFLYLLMHLAYFELNASSSATRQAVLSPARKLHMAAFRGVSCLLRVPKYVQNLWLFCVDAVLVLVASCQFWGNSSMLLMFSSR